MNEEKIKKYKALKKMMAILREHNIEMSLWHGEQFYFSYKGECIVEADLISDIAFASQPDAVFIRDK